MTLTLLGMVILPVGACLALLPSRLPLLYMTLFFAPFSASAVLNFPSFGLQPGYYLGCLWLGRLLVEHLTGGFQASLRADQRKVIGLLALFLGVVAASVLLVPWYDPLTTVQRPSSEIEWLRLTGENVTQLAYVLFVIAITISVGIAPLSPARIRTALLVILFSGVFVGVWGWAQLLMHSVGVPYPDYLFNNNVSFSQLFDQRIPGLGLKRMTSVAPEPSMLARFLLIPAFVSVYALYDGEVITSRTRALVLCLFLFTTLLATTSSTALIGIGLGFALLLVFLLSPFGGLDTDGHLKRRLGRIAGIGILTLLLLPLAFLALARFALDLQTADILRVLDLLMLEKLGSTSGLERGRGALHGLALFGGHPILGVGWGSHRTFDLFTNLLATTGILGLATFAAAHVTLSRGVIRLWRRLRALGESRLARPPAALLLGLVVALAAKVVAEPDLVFLDYWLLLGLVLATLNWPNQLQTRTIAGEGAGDSRLQPTRN